MWDAARMQVIHEADHDNTNKYSDKYASRSKHSCKRCQEYTSDSNKTNYSLTCMRVVRETFNSELI